MADAKKFRIDPGVNPKSILFPGSKKPVDFASLSDGEAMHYARTFPHILQYKKPKVVSVKSTSKGGSTPK